MAHRADPVGRRCRITSSGLAPTPQTVRSSPVSALRDLLSTYRQAAQTNREAGTYFEELTVVYLKTEPSFKELYRQVLTHADWSRQRGLDQRDTGIDLVAETGTGEVHAIQCKLYPPEYVVQKSDLDSFFTASGKKVFSRRIIVATTDHFGVHAEAALEDQQPPVTKIDLAALEGSVIDWASFKLKKTPKVRAKKSPLPHQKSAIDAALRGLRERDRGKLIMACGTGKTYTSLKVAEAQAGAGKRVLFLVPSLALLSQTLTEWTQETHTPLASFAVCSDSDVGKKRRKDDDTVQTFVHELKYPATTHAASFAREVKNRHDAEHMTVVFSTYHSIAVLSEAQKKHDLPEFDLIVCDEAHRTTGATFEGEDESEFVRVHDNKYVRGKKRLYMTATPRIYGEVAKATAEQGSIALASMDDETLFGSNLHVLTFSDAVKRGLLVDYKVIVLSVDEKHVSDRIQNLLKDENNQLRMDDAAKIIGCWKALSKQGLAESLPGAPADERAPMKRAVAFCQVIERQQGAKVHKVSSKLIAEMFQAVVEAYQESEPEREEGKELARISCEAAHVDGTMNASEKETKIAWLKAAAPENTSRILSNVRCLSEGVDVPALDAVLFLTPRNSQIDVVQSVGRVMRNAPGKRRGYIVLPVVIPAKMEPHEALQDNQVYKVVWQVLQALRSHDDRFDAMINKLDLTGKDTSKMEVIAITDKLSKRAPRRSGGKSAVRKKAQGGSAIGTGAPAKVQAQTTLAFDIGEIERAIYARLVEKVGNRHHWEDWAKDIARIARTHVTRVESILGNNKNAKERAAFERFARELRDDINDSISDEEIVEMLAQHLVTKPVFDALFAGHDFASQNSMSKAMQDVLDALQEHHLEKEADTLQAFYESVKLRAEGIDSAEGKQRIVVELYDKFFRNAFPKMSERLGIVYTPVEIIDFILKSVDHLLRTEFGQTLGSEGVHIIDPFAGTGTFITRLFQSGLLTKEELAKKYKTEIHANEIVLLAYYIAAINIELAYFGVVGGKYQPFEGICLTDTFQLYEKDDLINDVLVENSARRKRQKKLDIRVVVGNPPYSVGQDSENDNNANIAYPLLDGRIAETYAAGSTAANKKGLYDSYVRAIRWASDRVGNSGVIGFVTNASFIETGTFDGLRKCLVSEFSSLYVFHLRGNQRTSGDRSRREGGKVFGGGSRAPVAISLLVKNPTATERGQIFFRDVGDYLTREEKLTEISTFGGVDGISAANGWTAVKPDDHGDWLKQRDVSFSKHLVLGDKTGSEPCLFANFSLGLGTNRDAWVYGSSKAGVAERVEQTIAFYNSELDRFNGMYPTGDKSHRLEQMDGVVSTEPTQISWSSSLKDHFARGTRIQFDRRRLVPSLYRAFTKQWLYFGPYLIHRPGQMPRIFPHADTVNRAIGVTGIGSRTDFSCFMADANPALDLLEKSQWYPLYLYESDDGGGGGTVGESPGGKTEAIKLTRRDAITDVGLAHFLEAYPGETFTKEDVFYYVYGVIHSPDFRERYADNLGKELLRVPRVATAADFWAFSNAGRSLGDLHVDYEKVAEFAGVTVTEPNRSTSHRKALYRVEKMRFGKGQDKTVIHYNESVTVSGIPLEAYEYVVSGRSAIEWVMERQSVTTDKASGIVKDANAWAIETIEDPRYPLSLLLRVITVSLQTMKVVGSLPALDLLDESQPPKAPRAGGTSATKNKGRHTLTGGLVIASVKDRRGTFHAREGFDVIVELSPALDERLQAIDVAPDDDGVVELRIRGMGTVDAHTGNVAKLVIQDFELVRAADPNAPSDALFERLAKQDPPRLLRMLKTGLKPAFLTHAAEIAGRQLSSDVVLGTLLELLAHESPLVREGAIYGLSAHVGDHVDAALRKLAENDPSPGVRTAARDALGGR
jgi:predicted helicase